MKFTGDGESGLAEVTAFSGSAADKLQLPVESAATETVTVRAEPARLGARWVEPRNRHTRFPRPGNALAGRFLCEQRHDVERRRADRDGEARSTLTTARETTVTATVRGKVA